MQQLLDMFTTLASPTIVGRLTLPPRGERRSPAPDAFAQGAIGDWLSLKLGGSDPWTHQSAALAAIAAKSNVVISTGTASGKTLPFQAAAVRMLFEGDGRAVIMVPNKALSGDQLARWEKDLALAGFDRSVIAELNGDIAMDDRFAAIRHARIILATPDAFHAWVMRNIAIPEFQRFLVDLRLLILDEAHVCENVFGTNCALLFRRIRAAQNRLRRSHGPTTEPLQILAATATIVDPALHMFNLTGCDFVSIGDEQDGSSTHERSVMHIDGPDHGSAGEAMMAEMLSRIADKLAPHAFIAFHDSRQGVERIATLIDRDDVLPYRSGFEAVDRASIEAALREGRLRGVVATSALELGIDIPQFVLGLNLGIPQSKKAFRQRLGRIGRAAPGLFALIAPSQAFRQFGSSLREFYEGSVEPSHLYLDNRFIQFAHARCLLDECEALDGDAVLPADIEWPASFPETFGYALPGARRPREFDTIASIGADRPHLNYPLRQICEVEYALREVRAAAGDRTGTIRLPQAIREAYPGAIYRHLRRPMRVVGWVSRSFEHVIRLEPVRNAQPTSPLLSKTVNASVARDELIEGRILSGAKGFLAETALQVNESVEGYRSGSAILLYRDLRKKDPNMTRKQRDMSTTGVIIRIDEPWFSGTSQRAMKTRKAVARALTQLLARERSIAPTDIDFADSNIAIFDGGMPRKTNDAIAIYDSMYGGLRLTEALYTHFEDFLHRLGRAADDAGVEALVSKQTADRLLEWWHGLDGGSAPVAQTVAPAAPGEFIIYAPESEVGIRVRGELCERKLLEPQLIPFQGTDLLMYRYESGPGAHAWVPHDQIEATGQNWRQAIWVPATNTIREIAA